ncbi:MAG: hypothetical protein MH825_01440 [Cyanobacteria bacterium]|nr:hypothetical protein [Cyanobacteriota bacterium]
MDSPFTLGLGPLGWLPSSLCTFQRLALGRSRLAWLRIALVQWHRSRGAVEP